MTPYCLVALQITKPENAKRGDKSNFYSLLFYWDIKMEELFRFSRPLVQEKN